MSDDLIKASRTGNMKKITELLDSGADPNYKNAKGDCALIEAIEKIKVVELLLNRRADPNIQDKNGNTALLFAAINNKTKVVDLLLDRGADPNIPDNVTGNTPLLEASKEGYGKIVELLLSKGANPELENKFKFTPIKAATRENHKSVIKMLNDYKGRNKTAEAIHVLQHTPAFPDKEMSVYSLMDASTIRDLHEYLKVAKGKNKKSLRKRKTLGKNKTLGKKK